MAAPKIRTAVLDETEARIREAVAKTRRKKPPKPKKEWAPPTLLEASAGHVLALDQTCTKTGWCHFAVWHGPQMGSQVEIFAHGRILQPKVPDRVGFEDTLTRAEWMAEEVDLLMEKVLSHSYNHTSPLYVVHEMPAVHGYRPESSLMAALGVRQAATRHHRQVHMVNNQHMKSTIGGPTCTEKAHVGPALEAILGPLPNWLGRWNEDSRDALGLGLTWLIDWSRERRGR